MITQLRWLVLALLLTTSPLYAQVTIPNTFVAGTTIKAADVNLNFSTLGSHALDRLSGGNLSGNITMDPGITIDGIDLSVALCGTCASGFKDLTLTSPAVGITVAGVNIVNLNGKIPAISSTYLASLDGSALTGLANISASNLTTGTVAPARLGSGSTTNLTFLRGDSAYVYVNQPATTAKVALYTAAANDIVLANGTFAVTLPAAATSAGQIIDVKNTGTGTITVTGNAAELIDAGHTFPLTVQYQSITIISDGTQWWIR